MSFSSLLLISALSASDVPETIEISARIPAYQRALSKMLPQQPIIDDTSFSADSLATLMAQSPAINLNGQGGLFQAINIRGFSRWRIQTLVEGIPIYTERRAGTAVEFLPPALIGQAYLTQGAASTQLGSGALGGGIDMALAIPEQTSLRLGYGHNQNHRDVVLQGHTELANNNQHFSWQFNHRHANASTDGEGNPIQDQFEHQTLALRQSANTGFIQDSLLLLSSANNIAKASADDVNQRFTVYPHNDHVLGKVLLDFHNTALYFHNADFVTSIARPGKRTNIIDNQSLDLGIQMHDDMALFGTILHWRAGIDARTGVTAFERELDSGDELNRQELSLDADQWESFVALDVTHQQNKGTWIGGSRLAHLSQRDNLSDTSLSDLNWSAFAGYAHQFGDNWQVSGYVSSAYRVPSLTERFFNGSTPRGQTLGDANLETETAVNVETTLAYQSDRVTASMALFSQHIDDYIERVDVTEELRLYRNLASAQIEGINYQFDYDFDGYNWQWELRLGGQWLHGDDQQGNPIADIAPAQHRLALSASADDSQGFIALTHRQSSHDIVSGELPTASVTTIAAGYSHNINARLQLAVNVTNLTDRQFVTSRDDLAPFARGRDIHVSVRYVL